MIYHIAERDNDFTMRDFVKDWAPALARRFQTINTHQLAMATKMPRGSYLFTDMERQSQLQLELQAQIYDQLEADGGSRLLNHPTRTLRRFGLAWTLYDSGLNSYRAFRVMEVPNDLRFPVFIRMEKDHEGSHTPLLYDWSEYQEAVCRLTLASRLPEEMLAIEYVDASHEPGVFAKYAAYRVGERIIPRGVFFSTEWMQNSGDNTPVFRADEKWEYLQTNPHSQQIMDVFKIANIEYGRIDYGMANGKMEVWEVNTNPQHGRGAPPVFEPIAREHQYWVAERLADAFIEIDAEPRSGTVPVRVDWQPQCLERQPVSPLIRGRQVE